MSGSPSVMLLAFGLFSAVGLIAAAFNFGRDARARRRTMAWRPVDGLITWSLVKEKGRRIHRRGVVTGHVADIKYKYSIGAKEFEGHRVYLGDQWREGASFASRLVDRYPPGASVQVMVDPARPGESVLEHGNPKAREEGIGALVFGAGVGTLLILILLFG
jgi:hypothetical protein